MLLLLLLLLLTRVMTPIETLATKKRNTKKGTYG